MTGLSPKPIPSVPRRAPLPPLTPPAGSWVTPSRSSSPRLLLQLAPKDCCNPREALRSQGRLHPCTPLHCPALHPCTSLSRPALHRTALHCIALHCILHRSTALSCPALHCTALHCIALHRTPAVQRAALPAHRRCWLLYLPVNRWSQRPAWSPGHRAPDPQSGGAKAGLGLQEGSAGSRGAGAARGREGWEARQPE